MTDSQASQPETKCRSGLMEAAETGLMEAAETEGDVDGAVRSSATEEEKVETEDEKEAEKDAGERVEVEGNYEAADVPNQIDVPDPILEDPNIPDEVTD